MPPRLRRRVDALRSYTVPAVFGSGGPTLDAGLLEDASKITAEDLVGLSRPGFRVTIYDTLEEFYCAEALEYVEEDELVEVTPSSIRIRKVYLTENERKRAGRKQAETVEVA